MHTAEIIDTKNTLSAHESSTEENTVNHPEFRIIKRNGKVVGFDASKISNELNKLKIVLPEGTQITPELIEENIGISKDYNNFELHKAIGARDVLKAHRIVKYFGDNPKDNPMVVTVGFLHTYFSKLLHLHGLKDKSPRSVAAALKISPYFTEEYIMAARNYPMKKVSSIIGMLREFDVKSKGVGANAIPQKDLLKEMIVKVMAS